MSYPVPTFCDHVYMCPLHTQYYYYAVYTHQTCPVLNCCPIFNFCPEVPSFHVRGIISKETLETFSLSDERVGIVTTYALDNNL